MEIQPQEEWLEARIRTIAEAIAANPQFVNHLLDWAEELKWLSFRLSEVQEKNRKARQAGKDLSEGKWPEGWPTEEDRWGKVYPLKKCSCSAIGVINLHPAKWECSLFEEHSGPCNLVEVSE